MNTLTLFPNEQWATLNLPLKDVCKRKYAVTNFGRIISYTTDIASGKFLSFKTTKKATPKLNILTNEGKAYFYVHKLVAENFLPKPNESCTKVVHLNRNVEDNNVKNLQWVTASEFQRHIIGRDISKQENVKLFIGEDFKAIALESSEKKYIITSLGRIISYVSSIEEDGIVMGLSMHEQGYKIWNYKDKGLSKHTLLHRLVATYFLEKPSDKHLYVIHLDQNRLNNTVQNLKWVTASEQRAHAQNSEAYKAYQLQFKNRSKLTGRGAKLTEGKVRLIKKILTDSKRTTRLKMIAKQFNISSMQLRRIATGENWGWVIVDN